jgi:hypothetical protein
MTVIGWKYRTGVRQMTGQELIDQLHRQVSNQRHHMAMGRDHLAQSYKPMIKETLNQLEALGYDALECLAICGE